MELKDTVPIDSDMYKVKFYYEFIDDIYCDWDKDFDELKTAEDAKSMAGVSLSSSVENENDANALKPEVVQLLERKDNHPIYLMVPSSLFSNFTQLNLFCNLKILQRALNLSKLSSSFVLY